MKLSMSNGGSEPEASVVKACINCAHYFKAEDIYYDSECWRYPPTSHKVLGDYGRVKFISSRPITADYNWCGEFKERTK